MNVELRTRLKRALAGLIPDSPRFRYLAQLPRLETWRKERTEDFPLFERRFELYDYLNTEVIGSEPIDYLEFGVYKGDTIKYWSEINDNPRSHFWGFDTFTGLPDVWENFMGREGRGAFDVGGEPPPTEDDRVAFVKGMFQDTLADFLVAQALESRLVIHNDSDLYSSTLYVMTRCHDNLSPGSIIVFDEFASVLHELRAWEDYCSAYRREYEVLGATLSSRHYYSQVAVRLK